MHYKYIFFLNMRATKKEEVGVSTSPMHIYLEVSSGMFRILCFPLIVWRRQPTGTVQMPINFIALYLRLHCWSYILLHCFVVGSLQSIKCTPLVRDPFSISSSAWLANSQLSAKMDCANPVSNLCPLPPASIQIDVISSQHINLWFSKRKQLEINPWIG